MPFQSDKQLAYLYSQKPEVAKKFAKHNKKKGKYSKGAIKTAMEMMK